MPTKQKPSVLCMVDLSMAPEAVEGSVRGQTPFSGMVVEYGKAFRVRVLGCDLKSFDIPGVERVDFDTLLRESDAFLYVPYLLANTGLKSV